MRITRTPATASATGGTLPGELTIDRNPHYYRSTKLVRVTDEEFTILLTGETFDFLFEEGILEEYFQWQKSIPRENDGF